MDPPFSVRFIDEIINVFDLWKFRLFYLFSPFLSLIQTCTPVMLHKQNKKRAAPYIAGGSVSFIYKTNKFSFRSFVVVLIITGSMNIFMNIFVPKQHTHRTYASD